MKIINKESECPLVSFHNDEELDKFLAEHRPGIKVNPELWAELLGGIPVTQDGDICLPAAMGDYSISSDLLNRMIGLSDYHDWYIDDAVTIIKAHKWEVIAHYMDDDIREAIHSRAIEGNLEFLVAYLVAHKSKFGRHFVIQ